MRRGAHPRVFCVRFINDFSKICNAIYTGLGQDRLSATFHPSTGTKVEIQMWRVGGAASPVSWANAATIMGRSRPAAAVAVASRSLPASSRVPAAAKSTAPRAKMKSKKALSKRYRVGMAPRQPASTAAQLRPRASWPTPPLEERPLASPPALYGTVRTLIARPWRLGGKPQRAKNRQAEKNALRALANTRRR
jgi:hypothetical protein